MKILHTTKYVKYLGNTYAVTFGGDDGNRNVVVRSPMSERVFSMRTDHRRKRGSNEAAKEAVLFFCKMMQEERQQGTTA